MGPVGCVNIHPSTHPQDFFLLRSISIFAVQQMSKYRTGLVFGQLALVPFPDSSDFGRCLKSKLKEANSYKSIWIGCIQYKWPKGCLKSEFPSVRISMQFGFWSFGIQKLTIYLNPTYVCLSVYLSIF